MHIHIVQQGETLASIAREYGIYDWRVIYDDPANADLKQQRPNPMVLYPGDVVAVPAMTPKHVAGATGARHRFRVLGDPVWLRIILKGVDDLPIGGADYTLEVAGRTWRGKTKPNGLIEHKIQPSARQGKLTVKEGAEDEARVLHLKIGHLDPVDKVTGWKARLNNLGYGAGKVNEQENLRSRSAVEEFQCDNDLLPPTGRVDPPTQAELKADHGS